MQNLKPNEKRAKNAVILIQVVLGMEIISLVSDYFQYDLLQQIAKGVSIPEWSTTANDLRQQIIGIVHLLVYIFSAVTFIQWFRRAYFNLHTKVNTLAHEEGAAGYSWFVPFVNLVRPYKIMKELYTETEELLEKKLPNYTQTNTTTLVGWWWAFWIINNLFGQYVFKASTNAKTIDALLESTMAGMISSLIGIPLALITIKVIKDYAAVEPLLFDLKDENPIETTIQNPGLI